MTSTTAGASIPLSLSPLDVSVPIHCVDASYSGHTEGLLTTGSISTPIPVTQLQSETLITPFSVNVSHQTTVSTEMSTAPKIGQKRPLPNKDKAATKKKVTKKSTKSQVHQHQNFTANLGTQFAGNLTGNRFSINDTTKLSNNAIQQGATLQRLPSGTFVLSGASGNVRLQSGANIVYLQQLTSSGGTTKVIQSPLIANANGTFSAVPAVLSTTNTTALLSQIHTVTTANTANSISSTIPTTISTKPKSHFVKQPIGASTQTFPLANTTTITTTTSSSAASTFSFQPGQTKPANLILTGSLPAFQAKHTDHVATSNINNTTMQQEDKHNAALTLQTSLKNLMLTLPSSQQITGTLGDNSGENVANQTQTIFHQLSQEELKCLANLIGKYSSHPNSPVSSLSSPASSVDSPQNSPLSPTMPTITTTSTKTLSTTITSNGDGKKSQLIALLDQTSSNTINNSLKGVKKVAYPLSLTQKVANIHHQQQEKSRTQPRVKTPRVVTTDMLTMKSPTSVSMPKISVSSKQQKVPITITIPLSRLPTSLHLSTATTKSINVPALSAYLAQQKFVLSTGKASSVQSRTVLLSPTGSKKSNSTAKANSVITSPKAPGTLKSPTTSCSKSSATITLHLPPGQSALRDSFTLKKAASDIKLVGVLNQKSKSLPLFSSPHRTSVLATSNKIGSPPGKTTFIKAEVVSGQMKKHDLSSSSIGKTQDSKNKTFVCVTSEGNTRKSIVSGNMNISSINNTDDADDIDFAVIPTIPRLNKPICNTSPIISASKIVRVPVGQTLSKMPVKSLVEVSRTVKSLDTPLMNSARKVGAAFQKSTEAKTFDYMKETTDIVKQGPLDPSTKLRFDPLGFSTNRQKLSSVLGIKDSMGKTLTIEENGQLRSPVVTSKTAAIIARNAFITDSKIVAKSIVSTCPSTPPLFTFRSSSTTISGTTNSPSATVRTVDKSLPVTIKSSDFIRMSNHARTTANVSSIMTVKVTKKESMTKVLETKPKVSSKKSHVDMESETKEEPPPPPYITRSGRVLRTRYSYSDDMERKSSPKKRKRTDSSSKDDQIEESKFSTPIPPSYTSPTSSKSIATLGNALDSLVEAAKLITSETAPTVSSSPQHIPPPLPSPTVSHVENNHDPLANLDSTTNLAATAMLELLSGNTATLSSDRESSSPERIPVMNTPLLEVAQVQHSLVNSSAQTPAAPILESPFEVKRGEFQSPTTITDSTKIGNLKNFTEAASSTLNMNVTEKLSTTSSLVVDSSKADDVMKHFDEFRGADDPTDLLELKVSPNSSAASSTLKEE